MFIPFFLELKAEKVPVTLREFLSLIEGMETGIAAFDVEAFYFLARTALIKDERYIDRFDRVFRHRFAGLEAVSPLQGVAEAEIPEEWLKKLAEKYLSEEEKKLVEALGRLRQADGDAAPTACRAGRPSPGRLEMDRYGRHLALRRLWLQSRGCQDRSGGLAPPPRRQGLGSAGVQGL
ncbi:hypothetical protein ABIE78_006150 [Sinorhizobium fredii]